MDEDKPDDEFSAFVIRQLICGGAWEILKADRAGAEIEALRNLLGETLIKGCGSDREAAKRVIDEVKI